MRTKHILFSIALGATFAACSSDDNFGIAVDNTTTDAKLSIRPLVDADITFGGITADTRFAVSDIEGNARPVWATNDQLGACIIDVPTYSSAATYKSALDGVDGKAIELYNITNYYGCNNAFVTSDAGETWQAEHPMVEGNYLFYAPYKEGLGLRSPLEVCVPLNQDASEERKALKEFYESGEVVRVGYQFLAGINGTQKPSVDMHDIFAYPKFKITNNFNGYLFETGAINEVAAGTYNGEMTIDKIEFYQVNSSREESPNVTVGGVLKHTDQTNATANAKAATMGVIKKLHVKENGFDEDGDWTVPAGMLEAKTEELLTSYINTAENKDAGRKKGVITTVKIGKTVASGKSYEFFCVMPAMKFNFDSQSLMAKVYVTIDGKEYIIGDGNLKANASALSAAAKEGYMFDAKGNQGLSSLTLINGQKLPAEAIKIVGTKLVEKTGVNNLLEIKLEGGLKGTAAKDVQLAVRKGNSDGQITDNEGLINQIENAANGTEWNENTSVATAKHFKIAANNKVVINSALIDALATSNGNSGGSFAISTVVPIANDVEVTGTNHSNSEITLKSASGKTYTIKLNEAVTTAADASDKYAIAETATPTAFNEKSVVIVNNDISISTSAEVKMKSLHVVSGKTLTLTDGTNALTAGSIRNDGTIATHGTISAKVGDANVAFMNNGVITIEKAGAGFTVTAGKGSVKMTKAATSTTVKIASGVEQKVIYKVVSDPLVVADIKEAALVPSVNTIEATNDATVKAADLKEFKDIKRIQLNNGKKLTTDASCDFKDITIELLGAASTWTSTAATTVISNATIEVGSGETLKLEKISVNGKKTSDSKGQVTADGSTAFWNGGEGDK